MILQILSSLPPDGKSSSRSFSLYFSLLGTSGANSKVNLNESRGGGERSSVISSPTSTSNLCNGFSDGLQLREA